MPLITSKTAFIIPPNSCWRLRLERSSLGQFEDGGQGPASGFPFEKIPLSVGGQTEQVSYVNGGKVQEHQTVFDSTRKDYYIDDLVATLQKY